MKHSIVPVVMAGGSGTRLWPLSRQLYPKQFLALSGPQTLFQQAVLRLAGLASDEIEVQAPCIVGNEEHRFLVLDQLREIRQTASTVLLEPVGRNTAPALTLAALYAAQTCGEDPILVVTPADQTVTDPAAFTEALRRAVIAAADGSIVILGITPDRPETGFGYIRTEGAGPVHGVAAFVEKPDAATARAYLEQGGYYWNGGMFVVRASVWLKALATFRPDIADATRAAWEAHSTDNGFTRPGKEAFAAIPSESIDYAVMEKCPANPQAGFAVKMVALDAGWSDLGAWDAVWQVTDKDGQGNVAHGDAVLQDSRDTLVYSTSRLVGAVGLDNVVVVETPDAVLVADRSRSQEVKKIVQHLEKTGRGEGSLGLVRQHRRRPALPGQAHHGQAQGDAEPADAPPPRRALDRRLRHRRGDLRREEDPAHREPEHLHPARRGAPPLQPRHDPAGDHRGAVRQLPRRGRHRAL